MGTVAKSPDKKKWDIFLSYRRSKATEQVVRWLQNELQKEPVESTTGQRFDLDVFVDVTEPHRPDFQRNLTPILEHSRALIVLADAGAAQRRPQSDYLYQELDWWADHRTKTPFIVLQLDSLSGSALLSNPKFKANNWDKVNCLDCFFEAWEAQPSAGEASKSELLAKLRESIRDYGQVVHHEEVERLKRRAVIATVFATIAVIGGFVALWQMLEAKQLARTSTSRSLLLNSREALARPTLDSTVLLAAHAVQLDPSPDQVSGLRRALAFPPRHFRWLRTGQNKRMSSLATNPDGTLLAAANLDGEIFLFDLGSGQSVGSLKGHTADIPCLAFSPDGERLASASDDTTVRIWDVKGKEQIGSPLLGHKGRVRSVAFSPDGKTIATGGFDQKDNSILLWDVTTGHQQGPPLSGHTDGVTSVAFDPKGRGLVSSSFDNSIIFWDVEKRSYQGEPLKLLAGPGNVTFAPDGSIFACSAGDNILLYDFAKHALLGTLKGHQKAVLSVKFSPDGKTIASGSVDETTILWDVTTRRMIGPPSAGQGGMVGSVAFGLGGKVIASSCLDEYDDNVIIWNRELLQPEPTPLPAMPDNVLCLAWSPDGQTLAYAGDAREIRFWDVAHASHIGPPLVGHKTDIFSVAYSPDGKTLVSGSIGKVLIFWDVATKQSLGEPVDAHEGGVWCVAFSPLGNLVASAGADKTVKLWNPANRTQSGPALMGHQGTVHGVMFNPDGNMLASCGEDGKICLWNANSRELIQKLEGNRGGINCVAFSPDGKLLASGGGDQRIILWDVATRQQSGSIPTVGRVTMSLTFSPDGRELAAGGNQSDITLWDVAARRQLGRTLLQDRLIWGLSFSPDGRTLASGSWKPGNMPKVQLWPQNVEGNRHFSQILNDQPTQLVKMSRSLVARELSPTEVRRYFDKSAKLYTPLSD